MTAPLTRRFGGAAPWAVAVTVPARNEEARILACLEAAAAALGGRGGIALVVNGSQDATLARAAAWFEASGLPGVLVEDPAPPPGSGVGRARRLAVRACRPRLAEGAAILTTDADACVAADWVTANLAELEGADLVCGTVLPDAAEFARLPAAIGQRGAVEGEYMHLTLRAHALLDPVPHDPAPSHLNAAGASLAFRLALYDDTGGIPALALGEDRAFAARAEARDWRVRHADAPRVTVACRLQGRTSGGMAGALRARLTEPDPLVDELLAPARQTLERCRLKGELRRRMQGARGMGRAWATLLRSRSDLAAPRMRLSQLPGELVLLRAGLAALDTSAGGVAA